MGDASGTPPRERGRPPSEPRESASTTERGRPVSEPRESSSAVSEQGVRALYVHLPFCRSRCGYCDFRSEPIGPHARAGRLQQVVDAVGRELEQRASLLAPRLRTVYVGGGTPTALPPDLLLPLVRRLASRLEPGGELTVEANPGTVDAPLLADLREAGATRLSLGVQSFAPSLLASLGRRVTVQEVQDALAAVRETGWTDWNLDLVFGMPGQDGAAAREDVRRALDSGAPHLSLYDLSYPSRYARRLAVGARETAADFAEAHYAEVVRALTARGHQRYEISAFALPGHRCRHNLTYWHGEDYVGVGPSAVGTVGLVRWTNPGTVRAYLAGQAPTTETLTPRLRLYEEAMLRLRTADGIEESRFASVLEPAAVEGLLGGGLLQRACGILSLTRRGFDLSTGILARVLRDPSPGPPPSTAGMP